MQAIKSIAALIPYIVMSFFSPLTSTPVAPSESSEYLNVSYGEYERNTMDIYLPASKEDNTYGALLFIHGGSWTSGDKSSEASLCKKYVAEGYVTASINYHYIDQTHPVSTNMNDIELAIKKLQSFCAEKGYNVTNLALHGYSSGGHLATLFSYSCPEKSVIPIAFVVNMAGPSDFTSDTWNEWSYDKNTGPSLACMLYGAENLKEYSPKGWIDMSLIPAQTLESVINNVSPMYYMNEKSVPTICGYAGDGKDGIVPTKNKTIIYEKLNKFNIEHDCFNFENSNHFLMSDPLVREALYDKVDDYCKKYFGY